MKSEYMQTTGQNPAGSITSNAAFDGINKDGITSS